MKVLSIDPGISTGWVFIDTDTEQQIFISGTIPDDSISKASMAFWLTLEPDVVIVEAFNLGNATGDLGRRLTAVQTLIMSTFPDAKRVMPGHWKPVTGRLELPWPVKLMTKHEQDAARMAYYWLRREGISEL